MAAPSESGDVAVTRRRSATPLLVGVLGVLGAAALFGTSGTARAVLAPDSWPPSVAAVRLLVGAVGLIAFVLALGRATQVRRLLGSGPIWLAGAAVAGYQGLFFVGVERAGVAVGTLVSLGLAPLMAGLLGWALREGAPGWGWAAMTGLAVVGLVLLTRGGIADPDLLGVLAALGAGACYAVYTVLGARLARDGHDPSSVMAAAFTVGALFLVPFLWGAGEWLFSPQGVALALWLGLMATSLAYLLFGLGLPVLQPGHIATLNLLEPVVATILGVSLLGEQLGPGGWLGCLLILLALAGLGLVERSPAARHGLPSG